MAFLATALGFSTALPDADASLCGSRLFSVAPTGAMLTEHDPFDGFTMGQVPMELAGETILGAQGIAGDWDTDEVFVLLEVSGVVGSLLGVVDPDTGTALSIGPTGRDFESLTIAYDGTLLAVTGETGPDPETVFAIDRFTGAATLFCGLGTSDTGEAISMSLYDSLLWHASGSAGPYDPISDTGVYFEMLTYDGPTACTATPLVPDALLEAGPVTALAHLGDGSMAWKSGEGAGALHFVDPYSGGVFWTGATDVAVADLGSLLVCTPFPYFRRGDANDDSVSNIADVVTILLYLFHNDPIECEAAADANDDDLIDIADPIMMLGSLFHGAPILPPPYPDCGSDPSAAPFDCFGVNCP